MTKGLHTIPESKLWHQFKKGDKDAFRLIYQRYSNLLFNYGRKITDSPEIVKDNIQDLFVELWHGRLNLSETDSVKFYLYKALRIKILKNLKERKKQIEREEFSLDQELGVVFSFENQLISKQLSEEQKIQLKETISNLSDRQREIIFLRFYDDFSYEAIAEIMEINLQSVHNLLHRTLKTLRENLSLSYSTLLFILSFL